MEKQIKKKLGECGYAEEVIAKILTWYYPTVPFDSRTREATRSFQKKCDKPASQQKKRKFITEV
jgi:hypothetical protein